MIDEIDRALIVATQGGLPLVSRPYHAIAEQLGLDAILAEGGDVGIALMARQYR